VRGEKRILTLASALPVLLAAGAVLLLAPASAARGSVVWTSPTPADNTHIAVKLGATLEVKLAASTSNAGVLSIDPVLGLPRGATVSTYQDKGRVQSIFSWRPTEVGDYTLRFVASAGAESTRPRTYLIHVKPNIRFPQSHLLTDNKVAHWADVLRRTIVRAQPRMTARAVTTLHLLTPDDTQNLVLVLGEVDLSPTEAWYRIRLAILPNNSTGWVPKAALGDLVAVDTHLYIDRARFTLVLKRNGVTVFSSLIGVGRSVWPTPRGEFYVRERLTRFKSPMYGPIAFGTSARSNTLTDWPGGGVIGIHGTNQPELLPGSISHGCIRMRNADIVKLARLMKIGTPLTIR
jgi:L,D-transpeptidase catalytic domain